MRRKELAWSEINGDLIRFFFISSIDRRHRTVRSYSIFLNSFDLMSRERRRLFTVTEKNSLRDLECSAQFLRAGLVQAKRANKLFAL